jgi:flagellar M-ring protein FliF
VAISTEVEERATTSNDSRGGDVTVASNLPTGDAAGTGGTSNNENTENRTLTNYEVSETQRAVTRNPGAVRRLTVAVLVNDVMGVDTAGAPVTTPRSDDELAALRDLVASAVGYDEARGDVLTLKSMAFEPIVPLGTEAVAAAAVTPLNLMSIIQIGVLAIVTLVLGLFVVRPILTSGRRAALPAPPLAVPPPGAAISGTVVGDQAATPRPTIALADGRTDAPDADPVARLRKMIESRETETIQILQSWIEDPDEVARA